MGARLLERDGELAALARAVELAGTGLGQLVLIGGEAGIGKTAMIGRLPTILPPHARLLVGHCDDLATPRVLGPLRDLQTSVGAELGQALRAADRALVLEAVPVELAAAPGPTVLVLEDVHWADEAALDVVRYLVRRIVALPAALVLTYPDDALDPSHPLRQVLGLVSRSSEVTRLTLRRLSPAAVRDLSAGTALDPDRVFGVTAGNPYFVGELLATGDAEAVPLTIADAVGGRLATLDPADVEALEQLAVIPSVAERRLVEELVPAGLGGLARAEQRGLMTVTTAGVGFRHELTRRAVVDRMSAARRIEANRRVLRVLLTRDPVDLSRVVHHAHQAGEQEAELWQRLAVEGYTIDAPFEQVVAAQRRAVRLYRNGDPAALGAALRWLSRICWWAGDVDGAAAAGDEAVTVLVGAGDDDLLARALSNQAQLHAPAGRDADAVRAATRGLALRPDPATTSHLLNNLGLALNRVGDPQGQVALEQSLQVALEADDPEEACRAYANLAWTEVEEFDLRAAEGHITAGIALAERVEFVMFSRYLHLIRARLDLAVGRWDGVVPRRVGPGRRPGHPQLRAGRGRAVARPAW